MYNLLKVTGYILGETTVSKLFCCLFEKESTLKGKNLLPSFRVDSFSKGIRGANSKGIRGANSFILE